MIRTLGFAVLLVSLAGLAAAQKPTVKKGMKEKWTPAPCSLTTLLDVLETETALRKVHTINCAVQSRRTAMSARKETKPQAASNKIQATEHIAEAHQLLKELRERVGTHPQLDQAILKLEMALNTLTLKTGGML